MATQEEHEQAVRAAIEAHLAKLAEIAGHDFLSIRQVHDADDVAAALRTMSAFQDDVAMHGQAAHGLTQMLPAAEAGALAPRIHDAIMAAQDALAAFAAGLGPGYRLELVPEGQEA